MRAKAETLQTCEACGAGSMADECPWCDDGLQSIQQLRMWSHFRKRMRHISGTYTFLQDMVLDILGRLVANGSDKAMVMWHEGSELMSMWSCADPVNGGRSDATSKLVEFNQRALDLLINP